MQQNNRSTQDTSNVYNWFVSPNFEPHLFEFNNNESGLSSDNN